MIKDMIMIIEEYEDDEGVDRGEKDGTPGDYDEDGEMMAPRESN